MIVSRYYEWTAECEFAIRFGGSLLLIRTRQTERCCEETEGWPARTVARLLEVTEDLEYGMNSIGTIKI